jgi:hypothetical protein
VSADQAGGHAYVYGMGVSPEVIYIVRRREKPLKPPLSGDEFDGGLKEH